MMKSVATFGILAVLGIASSASALIITGQGTALPGGGSCAISGITTTGLGATVSCTGINLAAHTKVYFGIRNSLTPNGNTMTGADPGAGSAAVFRSSSTAASSITYTSTTTVASLMALPAYGTQTTTNRLNLTRTAGAASVVATGGTPGDNTNGDIGHLFQITSGSTLTLDVDILASNANFALGQACPVVYDPSHAAPGAGGDHSRVDVQFYWSDCGDGLVDSPEACDDGGANGSLASCCTTTCTFKPMGTLCTDDGNPCKDDVCSGASAVCTHPNNSAPCSDGVFCNGSDTCGGGTCSINPGDPCLPLNTGDASCSDSCNEGADNCTAPDPNGTSCDDVLFCNGTDTCTGGACTTHTGDPCVGPDGDTNCSESCDEGADNCLGADPDGTLCRAAAGTCDVVDNCNAGACPADAVQPLNTLCDAGSGDICDPDEVCDGASASCPADTVTPSSTVCRPGSGDTCDPDETCTGTANQPCPPDDVEPFGTVCNPGSGDVCDPDEVCPGVVAGSCAAEVVLPSGTVCNPGTGDICDPDETCSGSPDQPCPADNVASASTVCRGPAGVCDAAENCTGTADQPCPGDLKEPGGTPCRPSTGVCDVAEDCDGASNACPADLFQPDGQSCSDGLFCNGDETCQTGSCAAGTDPCTFVCSEGTDMCLTTACPNAMQNDCRTSTKKLLLVKNKMDNTKDKLIWKFIKGEATTTAEFANPEMTAAYALCIYAGTADALVATVSVPPNGLLWNPIGTKGYKYKDKPGTQNGVQKIIVKGGAAGKTKALLKGKGDLLPDPLNAGALGTNVTVQLLNHETGICWETTFSAPKKDTTELYKAKQ